LEENRNKGEWLKRENFIIKGILGHSMKKGLVKNE